MEGMRGWAMPVAVSSAHKNILLGTPTQSCLFRCDAQPWLLLFLWLPWPLCRSGPLVSMCLRQRGGGGGQYSPPKLGGGGL